MKNRISLAGLLLAGVLFLSFGLSSCKKGSSASATGSAAVVPTDAALVMELDMEKITLKSNFLSYKDEIASLMENSAQGDEAVQRIADGIRKVDDGGMNFNKPVYFFITPDFDGFFLVTSVRNKEEIRSNFEKLDKKHELTYIEEEASGITWINAKEGPVAALTNEVFLLGKGEREYFDRYMHGTDSFFDTPVGKEMKNRHGEITFALNCKVVTEDGWELLYDWLRYHNNAKLREIAQSEEIWNLIRKMQVVYNVTFTKGEITLNSFIVDGNPLPEMLQTITPEIYDKVPARDLALFAVAGVKGKEVSAFVRNILDKSGNSVDNETRMALMFLNTLEGNAAIGMYASEHDYYSMYDRQQNLIAWLPQGKQSIQNLINMAAGGDRDKFFVTGNDQFSAVSNMRSYQYGNVRDAFDFRSRAEGSQAYFYVNFPVFVGTQPYVSNQDKEMLKFLKSIEFKFMNINDIQVILSLTNDQRNSLDVILRALLDAAKEKSFNLPIIGGGQEIHPYMMDDEYDEYDEYDYMFGDEDYEDDYYPYAAKEALPEVNWND